MALTPTPALGTWMHVMSARVTPATRRATRSLLCHLLFEDDWELLPPTKFIAREIAVEEGVECFRRFVNEVRLAILKRCVPRYQLWCYVKTDTTIQALAQVTIDHFTIQTLGRQEQSGSLGGEPKKPLGLILPPELERITHMTQQAYLETVIFRLDARFTWEHGTLTLDLTKTPFLQHHAPSIRHLDLAIRITALSSPSEKYQPILARAIRGLHALRTNFANLAACVLTLDMHTPAPTPFAPAALQIACRQTFSALVPMATVLAELIENFVREAPVKARLFVRVRSTAVDTLAQDMGQGVVCYGPLVRVDGFREEVEGSVGFAVGSRVLSRAYVLKRSGPRKRHEDEDLFAGLYTPT